MHWYSTRLMTILFANYITSLTRQGLFLNYKLSFYISLSASLSFILSGMFVLVGYWRRIYLEVTHIVFIDSPDMWLLWEFLLTLRLSLISQNALMFCSCFWSLTTYNTSSVTQQTVKLMVSLTINGNLILKQLSLICATVSSDRTWLSIGSHSLSPSDMFICLLLSHQFICCKISGDLQEEKYNLLVLHKLSFVVQSY